MLQSVLEQLRPSTKDSPPTIARLEALLDHWLNDAGMSAGVTDKLSPERLSRKQKQRLKEELGDAWFFVRNVPAAQRADVHAALRQLATAAGRAALVEAHGARFEKSGSVVEDLQTGEGAAKDGEVQHERPLFAKHAVGTAVRIVCPTHATHHKTGEVIGFDQIQECYHVQLDGDCGAVIAPPHSVVKASMPDLLEFLVETQHLVKRPDGVDMSEVVLSLDGIFGETIVAEMLRELISMPTRRGQAKAKGEEPPPRWTVCDDLLLIRSLWTLRGRADASMNKRQHVGGVGTAACDEHRLRELRMQLPTWLGGIVIGKCASSAPHPEALAVHARVKAPKQPATGYAAYKAERLTALRSEMPMAKMTEITIAMGREWDALSSASMKTCVSLRSNTPPND